MAWWSHSSGAVSRWRQQLGSTARRKGLSVIYAAISASIALAGCGGGASTGAGGDGTDHKTCVTSKGHAICVWHREPDVYGFSVRGFAPHSQIRLILANPEEPSAKIGKPLIDETNASGSYPYGTAQAGIVVPYSEKIVATFTARSSRGVVEDKFNITRGSIRVLRS